MLDPVWSFVDQNTFASSVIIAAFVFFLAYSRALILAIRKAWQKILASEWPPALGKSTDSKEAQIEASFRRDAFRTCDWIVLRNTGEAPAEKVEVLSRKGQMSPLIKEEQDWKLPARLGPGEERKLMAKADGQAQPPFEVALRWAEGGTPKEREMTLQEDDSPKL